MLKKEEINIFKGVFQNWIFWAICACTFFGEMAFVEYGGSPCRVAPLPLWMHILALVMGMATWVFALINKLLPDGVVYVPQFLLNHEEQDVTKDDLEKNLMTSLRKPMDVRTGSLRVDGTLGSLRHK